MPSIGKYVPKPFIHWYGECKMIHPLGKTGQLLIVLTYTYFMAQKYNYQLFTLET